MNRLPLQRARVYDTQEPIDLAYIYCHLLTRSQKTTFKAFARNSALHGVRLALVVVHLAGHL